MVGVVDPRPSDNRSQNQSSAVTGWLSSLAPIQLRRAPPGRYSPKIDEHCLTWCSQSVRGRYEGQDPFCRTICIRRVFEHEVKNLLQPHVGEPPLSGSQQLQPQMHDLKYPLPPEGQPEGAIVDGIVGGPNIDGRPSARDVRFWQEGWYIWMSKSRWAAQEKMDLMMLDLERQNHWMRAKEEEERAWFDSEVQRVRDNVRNVNGAESWPEEEEEYDSSRPATIPDDFQDHQSPHRHPYPNIAMESTLIRVPSSLPSTDVYFRHIFAPTGKLLGIVQESIESGAQKELAGRLWDTARSGAPFILAKNAVKRCWDAFSKGSGDEDGEL